MKKSVLKYFIYAAVLCFLFLVLTVLVLTVDVQPIGRLNSNVGLATLNNAVFQVCGDNPFWYVISEICGVLALLVAGGFAALGVWQWISRKSLKKVDKDLFLLAGLYAAMMIFYVFFEVVVINYRPILVNGDPEASYPSSHTMLVCVIMLSAVFQLRRRIKHPKARLAGSLVGFALCLLTALGRLFSGMHWYTDVLAGIFLGSALAVAYMGVVKLLAPRRGRRAKAFKEIKTEPEEV